MSREIKFRRAHFKDEAKTILHHIDEWGVNVSVGKHNADFLSPSSNNVALYFTDLQYTGLKDKNGKEIYEGDIVKGKEGGYENIRIKGWDGYRTGEVVFNSGMWCYTVFGRVHQGLYYLQNAEVIGNIYENPELTPS